MRFQKFEYIWAIAYISRDHIDTVEMDLVKHGFSAIKVYIPTVRILKKQFKNKNIYEYVPLLFNYGFFQLPYEKACDAEFLKVLREKIPAIYAWVTDPITVINTKPNLRSDNNDTQNPIKEPCNENGIKILKKPEINIKVAVAQEAEIAELYRISQSTSVFSDGIIDKLDIGSFIVLQGYPYEGIPAEIVSINKTKKQVKVRLLLETLITIATVSFENIFYTVYSDYDKKQKEDSLDELNLFGKRNLDKLYAKINYGDE